MGSLFGGKKPEPVKPSEEEIALAEIGVEQWNYYTETFRDKEMDFARELRLTDTKHERARSDANVAVEAASSAGYKQGIDALYTGGYASGSGQSKIFNAAMNQSTSTTKGKSLAHVDAAAESENSRGLTKALALGRNKADVAVDGLQQAGRSKTQLAISKMNDSLSQEMSKGAFRAEIFGAAAGAGMQMYGGKKTPTNLMGIKAGIDPNTGEAYRAMDGNKYWGNI